MRLMTENQERIIKENAELRTMLQKLLDKGSGFKDIMNTKECAEYLGVSEARIRNLVYLGEIPVCKNAKATRNFFRREEIDNWRASRRVKTNSELRSEIVTQSAFGR